MANIVNVGTVCLAKVVCYDSTNLQVGINTLWYAVTAITGVPAITDAQLAGYLDGNVSAAYKAWINNNCSYRGVSVQIMAPVEFIAVNSIVGQGVGVGGATSLPNQVSGLLKFVTNKAGRAFRGRIYPPFPSTAWANANGELNAAGLAALGVIDIAIPAAHTIVSGANSATFQLVIWHRKTRTFDNVTATPPVGEFATQRRRGQLGRTNLLPF